MPPKESLTETIIKIYGLARFAEVFYGSGIFNFRLFSIEKSYMTLIKLLMGS